jgi:hypothetical protein
MNSLIPSMTNSWGLAWLNDDQIGGEAEVWGATQPAHPAINFAAYAT